MKKNTHSFHASHWAWWYLGSVSSTPPFEEEHSCIMLCFQIMPEVHPFHLRGMSPSLCLCWLGCKQWVCSQEAQVWSDVHTCHQSTIRRALGNEISSLTKCYISQCEHNGCICPFIQKLLDIGLSWPLLHLSNCFTKNGLAATRNMTRVKRITQGCYVIM